MAYKIKKSILAGTTGHRRALKLTKANLSIQRNGYKNMPDGRSTSSPFQLTAEEIENAKRKIGETKTTKDVKTEGSITQTTTTAETPWTEEGTDPTYIPAKVDICKEGEGSLWKQWKRNPEGFASCKEMMISRQNERKTEGKEGVDTQKTIACKCKPVGGGKDITFEAIGENCFDPNIKLPPECAEKPEETQEPCWCISTKTGEKVTMDCPGRNKKGRKLNCGTGASYSSRCPEECQKGKLTSKDCKGMTRQEVMERKAECEAREGRKGEGYGGEEFKGKRGSRRYWVWSPSQCECVQGKSKRHRGPRKPAFGKYGYVPRFFKKINPVRLIKKACKGEECWADY